tara:strand:- start:129 stop:956 length:828 start_codon:yes stop_codon:yes gene_type:complete
MQGSMLNSLWRLLLPAANVKVVVLGHQKTGTSAIAALLGKKAALEMGNDPLYAVDQGKALAVEKLLSSPRSLTLLCHRHPRLFGQPIIKDPDLIFVFSAVEQIFHHAKFLFVVRDPRDTIRSICNRLDLSGKEVGYCPKRADMHNGNRHWELILSGQLPSLAENANSLSPGHVLNLAIRWNHAAEIYLENSSKMKLLRYEDFIIDKEDVIEKTAKGLGLPCTTSIDQFVDVQYQPRGDATVKWNEFYSAENMQLIEEVCGEMMKKFGYQLLNDGI